MSVKGAALAAITQDAFLPLWRSLTSSSQVVVLMMHRFADRELSVRGVSPTALRANLEFLRRHKFHLASLGDLIREGYTKAPSEGPTVVFTVDDGYADFARIGGPIFAEFDCPVTVFTVTGALDGALWFWWDRVQFVLETSKLDMVALELSTGPIHRRRLVDGNIGAAYATITEALKKVPNAEKEQALVTFAETMGVDVPPTPTQRFAAMTWDDVRQCAKRGATFGPHTVRHPILTQVDAATATQEIVDSWTRLRAQCDTALPVFCYPNGYFSREHIDLLAKSPLRAAVATDNRYAHQSMFVSPDPAVRFAVPRFPYSDDRDRFVQVVAGVERVKMGVREALRGFRRD
jgi:peptidoglycan/xylan/chitin deacetylase (PgdA/CDA1 family)